MRHTLGTLRIDLQSAAIAMSFPRGFPSPAALEQFRRDLDPRNHTDLLVELDEHDPDRAWVEAVAATVLALRAERRQLALLDCRRTTGGDGECGILLREPANTASVRTGDDLSAGVAILRADSELRVLPRVFRRVCANGAIMTFGADDDREVAVEAIDDRIRDCLSPERLVDAAERMRAATLVPVLDPLGAVSAARIATPLRALLGQWAESGDRSAFGLVNAATALAHGEPRLSKRLDRERDAERLLQACVRDARLARLDREEALGTC